MSAGQWGGRKVAKLLAITLALKGTVCHLCGEPGANSPDHDPPRVELLRAGVADPDHPRYLFPAHLLCNITRQERAITPELRAEVRAKYLASVGRSTSAAPLSPRFARRRPFFESVDLPGRLRLPLPPPATPEKTEQR